MIINNFSRLTISTVVAGVCASAVLLTLGGQSHAQSNGVITNELSAQAQGGEAKKKAERKAAAPRRDNRRAVVPRGGNAQKVVVPRGGNDQRIIAPHGGNAQQVVVPKGGFVPRGIEPHRGAGAQMEAQPGGPGRVPRAVVFNGARAVNAGPLRALPFNGAGRALIHGQNFSAWRNGYRVRNGGVWRTFVALSVLGAIGVGADLYYPYAYVSAPESLCDGVSKDGCQMMWDDVATVEGGTEPQCVAYCPWQ
jgi:hypothetical protein